MVTDQEPIPTEALPPGWGPADNGAKRIAYRHSRPRIELSAALTEGAQFHPSLGIERCWELRYECDIGELPVRDSICRVATRTAAIEGLLECMERVQDVARGAASPMDVEAALKGVRFGDVVPDGALTS